MMQKKQQEPRWMKARSTSQARRAIADFVDNNTDNLTDWLHRVAYGDPKTDKDGNIIRDAQGSIIYVNKPDPGQAVKLVADLAEFHMPRLMRSDVAMVAQVEHNVAADNLSDLSTAALQARLLQSLGIASSDGQIIDVTPEPEVVPVWLEQEQE